MMSPSTSSKQKHDCWYARTFQGVIINHALYKNNYLYRQQSMPQLINVPHAKELNRALDIVDQQGGDMVDIRIQFYKFIYKFVKNLNHINE